jgi:hypothetical protein
MNDTLPLALIMVVFATLFVVVAILVMRWHFSRSAAILQRWADEKGYEVLEKSYRYFFRGPFFFRASKEQAVYRVTVRDKAGNVGTGWVACGSWWFGLWSDQAQVRWDEVPQATASPMRDRWMDG